MENCCRYCNYNLDDGDVFEVLSNVYKNYTKEEIIIMAGDYGWTSSNKIRFSKTLIIQFDNKPQIEICPKCSGIWPNDNDKLKQYYKE